MKSQHQIFSEAQRRYDNMEDTKGFEDEDEDEDKNEDEDEEDEEERLTK